MKRSGRSTVIRRPMLSALVALLTVGLLAEPGTAALTKRKVKKTSRKVAAKQIDRLVPGMIDQATLDSGVIPPVTASISDPLQHVFTSGPFTLSLDCQPDVEIAIYVRTTEENSMVADGNGTVSGDLDPADGDMEIQAYTGNASGGDAFTGYPYYEVAALYAPSGAQLYVQLNTVTNFKGNDCYVGGWFLDLAGDASARSAPAAEGSRAPVKKTAKKVATKQINALVPGLIDEATIEQSLIPPVTASTSDPNVPVFSRGPLTISLDCSLDAGNIRMRLLVRTTEENSVANVNNSLDADLDPGDGDQIIFDALGNPPGADSYGPQPYDAQGLFRAPSGAHFYVQFIPITGYLGNDCYVNGFALDLGTDLVSRTATRAALRAPGRPKVKKIAKKVTTKEINNRVPGLIDEASFDQGYIPPVTASVDDPNVPMFSRGPFSISLDCSLDSGNVSLRVLVTTTEENSVVNSGAGWINGDFDPSDGAMHFVDDDGNPPGGEPSTGSGLGYQYAVFLAPSGASLYGQFDALTNHRGNDCYVDGFFLDIAG